MRAGSHRKIRTLSFTLAAFMILTCITPKDIGAIAQSTGSAQNSTTDQANTYYSYISQYKSVPYADNVLTLDAQNGILKANAIKKPLLYGVKNSVALNEGGSITWNFTVPQTALYCLNLNYLALPGSGEPIQLKFLVDNTLPFDLANDVSFTRTWQDYGGMRKDYKGNDVEPLQREVEVWRTEKFQDTTGYHNGEYYIYLTKGAHTFYLESVSEPVAVKQVILKGRETIPAYSEVKKGYQGKGYKEVKNEYIKVQAEAPTYKSDSSTIADSDRSDAATEPNSALLLKKNYIYQNLPGQWMSYDITVPESGLYKLSFKYWNDTNVGVSVFRDIYIDGAIPFKEMKNVQLYYSTNWQMKTITDSSGKACLIYLSKGTHEVKMAVSIGKYSDVLEQVDQISSTLNQLYRRIIMITSTTPDSNRDYELDSQIPGLIDTFRTSADRLYKANQEFGNLNGGRSSYSALLKTMADQLVSFVNDPTTIPTNLGTFQQNIAAVSDWLYSNRSQWAGMDYLVLSSADRQLQRPTATFWEALKFSASKLFASFSVDYNDLGSRYSRNQSITVWALGAGRHQGQIAREMIDKEFSTKTGIKVNLNISVGYYVEATLAGKAPDVVLGIPRGQPVNLACRGALVDLSKFSTYKNVIKRFGKTAEVPYQYNGGTFGIPESQTFFMMFYRTDIFSSLGLQPPQTWDDFYKVLSILQMNNMNVGVPYSVVSSSATADVGMGVKDLFSTLLMQNGVPLYNSSHTKINLTSPEAYNCFKNWSDLYTKYGLQLTYTLNAKFRSGEYPLAIGTYDNFFTISSAAPEIRGLWKMVPIPGTRKADGTIDRSSGAGGSADVIWSTAKNKEQCWQFIDWWTSDAVQYEYAIDTENNIGIAGRSTTANIAAFDRLPWSKEDKAALEEQRSYVKEIPQVPGDYFVSICLDNAFRSVVYLGKSAREQYEVAQSDINGELARKRVELGLD